MAKTGSQIEGDVYALLKRSTLSSMISGGVYREGCRPRDSKAEDAVVIFTTGLADEIQTGVVTVNIYFKDFALHPSNGVLVKDGRRAEELERLADAWVRSLTAAKSCYLFRLHETIHTEPAPDIHQHFVVVKLRYRFYGGDDAQINQ